MSELSHQLPRGETVRRPTPGIATAIAGLRAWRMLVPPMRPSAALLGLAATLVVVMFTLTGGLLWHLRAKALDEAERELRNLNGVLAEQTARSVQHVDFILRTVVERVQAEHAGGRSDESSLTARMRELIADTPQIRTMVIAGADGFVTHSSVGRTKIFIGDRPHFLAQRDEKLTGPYISVPLITRTDGKPAISISRRISAPNGAFAGIVSTSLDPDYFKDIYRGIDLGKASAISLVRSDGINLIDFPDGRATGEKIAADDTEARRLSEAASGIFRDRDVASGADRLVGFHRVGTLPLISVVSVTIDTVLLEWRQEVRAIATSAVVAATILCLLISVLAKEVRRRDALAEALRANEERFRNFAEASSDWFWEQDANLRFSYLSSAVYAKSGLSVAEHLGKTRRQVVHHGVTAEQWHQHQADLDARRPFRDFRFQRADLDGSLRHISISGRPVFGDDGTFRGYSGNARDITAEIQAEQRLREAKSEAEAASRTKGEFLAIMSHELRTPLNAIIGFSDLISREILGPIGTLRYREYAGDILTAGHHLLELINDILDMSKIEARKMELFEEDLELSAIAESCAKIVERQAVDGRVALVTEIAADLPHLRADALRLKQIVLNLLSNAVKFTPADGRVTLTGRLVAEGALEIAVIDTGIGMNDDEMRLALEPFRQVESAMARKHEGTGLGLPLVKAFAELHGGTLALRSERGVGTVARVVMPASRVVRQTPIRATNNR
jgi:PAS domain S-box-containing protein